MSYAQTVPPNLTPERLRAVMQRFVRSFGLLSVDRTPCGESLSISEAPALKAILERQQAGDQPVLKTLGGLLGIDKSNVTRLCQRLEEEGFITLQPCPTDGRARCIRLTANGMRRARAVETASRDLFAGLLEALPRGSAATTIEALEALGTAIQVCRSSHAVARRGADGAPQLQRRTS
jgi:DNA-binding MarR family transcriptional regulator